MGRFHNEWGEARNPRSRKLGEPVYVPVSELPDKEEKDPESLLIAREEGDGEEQELRDLGAQEEAAELEIEKEGQELLRKLNGEVQSIEGNPNPGVGESRQHVEGLRKAAAVKGVVYPNVLERRFGESGKRGKGGKFNKPKRGDVGTAMESELWKKAA